MRLRDRLSKLLLFNLKAKKTKPKLDLKNFEKVYETTRLEWFIKTNENEPLLAFNDGLVASKLISKILAESQDDENVI